MDQITDHWYASHRADQRTRVIADRHYNRQKVGAPQFVPPGRCRVLVTEVADAFWVTSWPYGAYVKHAWPGAWICSAFRNESPVLSSLLIREAVMATVAFWGEIPDLGMISFIDATKVRKKRDWGRCYLKAGWERERTADGEWARTKAGLYVVRATRDRILSGACC